MPERPKAPDPYDIVLYPDPFLNQRAREVTPEEIRAGKVGKWDLKVLLERMTATLYEHEGLGLAAPQVGVGLRIFLADPSTERTHPVVVINPVLREPAGTLDEEEGCLSIPGVRAKVRRHESLTVSGLGPTGEPVSFRVSGLFSRICQHETDHLDGVLFIQRIGAAARFLLRRKLHLLEDEYAAFQRRPRSK